MGHRPSWLPVVPLHGGQHAVLAVWLPALLVPGRFATEGLVWVRTSGGGRVGGLRTRAPMAGHMLHSSARLLAGGGGGLPPALSSALALEGMWRTVCVCAVQTQRCGGRGCCSGRLALAQRCGGVKSTAPTLGTGLPLVPSPGTAGLCGPPAG